jgi:hypothetical protein
MQMCAPFLHDAKVNENRFLKPFPKVQTIEDVSHFLPEAITWFNNNYGFRGYFIRLKDSFDYWIFHKSTKLYLGKDGWLFYRSVLDNDKPTANKYLQENASSVMHGIEKLKISLASKGVHLFILIPPMKDVVYPQFLPESFNNPSKYSALAQFGQNLATHQTINYINSLEILQNTAKTRPVFYKTDFHWNDPAAFEIAKNLVGRIDQMEGIRTSSWKHSLKTHTERFSGGEALFMPIFPRPLSEDALFIDQNWSLPEHSSNPEPPIFSWIYKENRPSPSKLKPLVIYGDSFSGGLMSSGLAVYFQKIYKIENRIPLANALDALPKDARYFLLEFIEGKVDLYKQLAKYGEPN